ncbi:hypothetical protein AB0A60_27180 [Streptomyces sp. NPDC046275]|uniref:YncE family protein n=1 Tax=Streptomyces sp. NPDC046275 TaxID=3157201 RepID=UPI0033C90BF9
MKRFAGGAAFITIAASLSVLGSPGSAQADSAHVLPVSSHRQTIADGAHRQVYSSAPGNDAVVVSDFDGRLVRTIEHLDGAWGLALSGDEKTLYVALREADAIAAVDTTTLGEVRRFAIGAAGAPENLAVAGGKLWFSHGDTGSGGIGSINIAAPEPVVDLGDTPPGTWYGQPLLRSASAGSDRLVAGETEVTPGALRVYDVGSGSAKEIAHNDTPGGSVDDMAVTPDGQNVITAAHQPDSHQQFRLSDLTETRGYATGLYPTTVAVAPDGTVAAGIGLGEDKDVWVYRPGETDPVRTIDLGDGSYPELMPQSLAWAPDKSRLFAVRFTFDSRVVLDVVEDPAKAPGALAVDVPTTAPIGREFAVRGTLSSSLPYPAGTTVTVTRDGRPVATPTVGADGSFHFTDRPVRLGPSEYRVTHAGDTGHVATGAAATVEITH